MNNPLSDLQFHRYKQTPVKVTSTKYGVVISSTTSFRLVDVYMCLILFMTTIDAILFLRDFSENFNEVPPEPKTLETGTRDTN